MDYDLLEALKKGWETVRPKLEKDPDLLAARLARRRLGTIRRPHRAWCIGVRASDRRITCWKFLMTPTRPSFWDEESHCTRYREHKVLLDAPNLRWLCRPVTIPKPHVQSVDAARMLGVSRGVIRYAVLRGQFSCRYIKGLLGKHCNVPMVYTPRLLDPSAFPADSMADIEWGTHWTYPCERLPDDLAQMVERHPHFRSAGGELRFNGWRWMCPGCKRQVHIVYYPLPALDLAPFAKGYDDGSPDDLQKPLPCFACYRCHNIQWYRLVDATGWNRLVSQLSGGLLTGREVKKPKWFAYRRKRAYCPRPNRAPSKLQPRLLSLLVQTRLDFKQMARHLKVTRGTVSGSAGAIYRRYKVHSRQALRTAFAVAASQEEKKAAG